MGKNIVVVLSLLAAGFFAAWLRYSPHLGSTGEFTDGLRQYDGAAEEPIRYAVWQEAERLAGALEEGEAEHRPAVSADGRWLVFVSGERGTNSELWISELVDGAAEEPRALFELNSAFDELSPSFRGDELYFASNRPGRGGFDLLRSRINHLGEFAYPEPLDDSINTRSDEVDPAPLPDGIGLAFSSNRNMAGRRGHDFYLALPGIDGAFVVEPLDQLNSWQDDRELSFTSDGRRAFFASNRGDVEPHVTKDFDLYASLNDRGSWLTPKPIEGLNTHANERGPAPNHNGLELIFERQTNRGPNRGDVITDLFQASTLELFQRSGPRVGWVDLLILIALLVLALLAVLAKRWDAIEVLYKCFLVSLLVHGAMLYWFRDIHPESELKEIPKSSQAYNVKLIPSKSSVASSTERGGALEVERQSAAEQESATPDRLSAPTDEASSAQAPSQQSMARAASPSVESTADQVEWERSETAASAESITLSDAPTVERKALERSAEPAAPGPQELQVAAELADSSSASASQEPGRLATQPQSVSSAAPSAKQLEKEGPRPMDSSSPGPSASTAPEPAITSTMAGAQNLRAPVSDSANESAKRSLTRSTDGDALPAVSQMEVAGRSSESPSTQPSRRTGTTGTHQPADHIQPGTVFVEAQVAVNDRGDDLPQVQLAFHGEAPKLDDLPDVPLPLASATVPARRRTLNSSQDASGELAAPAPTRFGRRRAVAERAAPAKRNVVAAASPASRVAPAPAKVVPDQRLAPTPLPEPAVARFEHTPYRSRFGPAKARALEEHGGSVETEAAVAAGLKYLADMQRQDGSWGDRSNQSEKYGEVRVGKTGLCLLAFLGAGHTADSNTEHSRVAKDAVRFLLDTQRGRTGHFGVTSAYGHGIATYALAECYALTNASELKLPLQRAVTEILRNQHGGRGDARRFGGWGYFGNELRIQDKWPRASVTAWQVMALESARLGGLEVPDEAFENAKTFLVGCMDQRRGAFRYSHDPSRLNGSYSTLPGSTPASLFALSLLEVDLESREFESAWRFLAERRPEEYTYRGDDAFVYEAHGNLYFWYYASLASMRRGGNTWKHWNANLQETLLPSQRDDGSWKPISTYARNYAGDDSQDASYSTAMNVLSLEVYYRYFTPLLKVSNGPPAAPRGSGR
jgi:hypothetical protein